jgi:ribosomal protein S18 acetylase RimI-like enzyme
MLDLDHARFDSSAVTVSERIEISPGPVTVSRENPHPSALSQLKRASAGAVETRLLKHGDEAQALDSLGHAPLQNVLLRGSILDHGLESDCNRGSFYGCFRDDSLIGVALIGQNILLQGNAEAVAAFAEVARDCALQPRLLLCEETDAENFCRLLLSPATSVIVIRETVEILLALTAAAVEPMDASPLRLALPDEAEEISIVNARGHLELNGFDPSIEDPEGFVERTRMRIEKGRVWVVRDSQGIAFKADVARVTAEAVYLEGILTRPDLRGAGIGKAALVDLCQRLFMKHDAVCLLADAESTRALAFYQRLGFVQIARHRLVRFGQRNS